MDNSEAIRLEELWSGQFGKDHMERNRNTTDRHDVWKDILSHYPVDSVLEVGCNIGLNLKSIHDILPKTNIFGIDVYQEAVDEANKLEGVNAYCQVARQLYFGTSSMDMVFTAGVLIHQPEEFLVQVMSEIVRVAKKYVVALEYYSYEFKEISYRGNEKALFKGDYGKIYLENFPQLKLVETKHIPITPSWDDVTLWVFTKEEL